MEKENGSPTQTWTCSMTRANKLLAQLRDGSGNRTVAPTRRYRYSSSPSTVYHKEVSHLTFTDIADLNSMLANVHNDLNRKLLRKRLVEKWKNKLFELNVRYGIHVVLSNIDLLQQEKTLLSEVRQSNVDNNCVNVNAALLSMNAVRTSEKKYDFKWNVTAFEQNDLDEQLKMISKEISRLDESKDKLNIENSFSIELSAEERDMLGI